MSETTGIKALKSAKEKDTKKPKSVGSDPMKSALRNLSLEIAELRDEMDALKISVGDRSAPLPRAPSPEAAALEEQMRSEISAPADAAVVYAFAARTEETSIASGANHVSSLVDLLRADDERVARIGYALSSPPKIALIRALLSEGPQSAAQLGQQAKLSTGSLYHHLRELVHADVIHQTGRNRYALTTLGQQTVLLLFAAANAD